MLLTLPESYDRDEIELELQLALGTAWLGSVGGQAPEVKMAYTRARELCEQLGKTSHLGQVAGNLSTFHYVRAEYQMALELAQIALSHAVQSQDPLLIAVGHWYNGYILFCCGEFVQASRHLEETIAFYDPQQHDDLLLSVGVSDAGIGAMAYDACCLWCLGYPDQAMKLSQEALVLANALNHPFTQADVICYAGCLLHAMCRDAVALKDFAERLMQLAIDKRLTGWIESGLSFLAEALAMLGNLDEGIAQMFQAIADMRSSDVLLYLAGTLGFLAEAQAKTGQPEVGLKTLGEALALVEQNDEGLWEPEFHRLRAKLLLMQDNQSEAEDSYKTAIGVARKQSAKSWELRASNDLARLWKSQGRVNEARELLEAVYAWFTEGFDTPDLKEAKALLEEMSLGWCSSQLLSSRS